MITLILCGLTSMSQANLPETEVVERHSYVMGTELHLTVSGSKRSKALLDGEAALCSLQASEARLSNWDAGSELQILNSSQCGESAQVGSTLHLELTQALALAEETDWAFSPWAGPLVELWELRKGGSVPGVMARDAAARLCGSGSWQFAGADWTRNRKADWASGGFGKGAGLKALVPLFADRQVTHAKVNLGGQWLFVAPADERLEISIAHPDRRQTPVVTWSMAPGSLATSGNSEKAFVLEGKSYGHILDGRTGLPAEDFGSVSVWSRDPLRADAMSTALFVMGPEQGMFFAEKQNDLEAMFVVRYQHGLQLHASTGLRGKLKIEPTPFAAEITLLWGAQPGEEGNQKEGMKL